jgi:aspartyl-tRNA(Asn)/glutamyl-tRNA(Gln) amidotransferase subunit A
MSILQSLADSLAAGQTTSRELIESALDKISDPAGEGTRVFIKMHAEQARAAADASDQLRAAGIVPSPLAGLPISVKDLFDLAGEPTTAGSKLLQNAAPATADAPTIARLRRAGAIVIGRTNMTEFAYSGLGINPHYGTPRNPWDRESGRIPGGSSSGAAVSVTDGMAAAAIGSDTGGSVRIPASLCGITGFKPTTRRNPATGGWPLSPTLDAVGPLANSVACCALLDAVMAGESPHVPPALPLEGLRLAVPTSFVLDGLDADVSTAFERTVTALSSAGARISEIPFSELADIPKINAGGGIYAEAYAIHRRLIEERGDEYDPRVRERIIRVKDYGAADFIDMLTAREALISSANATTAPYDAVILPTTATIAPPIADLEADDKLYVGANTLMLRNTFCFNFLDRCALSLPMHRGGEPPTGLMVVGETMGDARLMSIGRGIEKIMGSR